MNRCSSSKDCFVGWGEDGNERLVAASFIASPGGQSAQFADRTHQVSHSPRIFVEKMSGQRPIRASNTQNGGCIATQELETGCRRFFIHGIRINNALMVFASISLQRQAYNQWFAIVRRTRPRSLFCSHCRAEQVYFFVFEVLRYVQADLRRESELQDDC